LRYSPNPTITNNSQVQTVVVRRRQGSGYQNYSRLLWNYERYRWIAR